jgi:hypothetical protein
MRAMRAAALNVGDSRLDVRSGRFAHVFERKRTMLEEGDATGIGGMWPKYVSKGPLAGTFSHWLAPLNTPRIPWR